MFGVTAKQWLEANLNLKGNIRDYAIVNELICLSNMECQIIYVDDRGEQKVIASFLSEKQACDFLVDYFKKSAANK